MIKTFLFVIGLGALVLFALFGFYLLAQDIINVHRLM